MTSRTELYWVSSSSGNKLDITKQYLKTDSFINFLYHSTSATVLSDMTVVSDATRKQLMDKVPYRTEGGTCISCGLQMAIDVTYEIFFNSLYESLESMNKFLFD
jgi:hypothetical protein